MRVPFLTALLVLCGAAAAFPQSPSPATVYGYVRSADGEALALVAVTMRDAAATERRVATDAAGRFEFSGVPAGRYTIAAAAVGFAESARAIEVAAAARVRVDIRVRTTALELAPLTVIGGARRGVEGVPGATHVVTRADIARYQPAGAHEMLRHGTGIHVQEEDPLGVNLNIGVRGLTARRSARVLLLEDGVPILLGPYGDPTAHYQPPAETLRRIEVVKGSGQIAHGPQTVGGVINFVRVTPRRQPGGRVSVSAGNHGRLTGHVQAGSHIGRHSALLTLDHRETDGARDGWYHRVRDVQAQLLLQLAPRHSLLLRAGAYTEASRFGETGLTQAEFENDPFANPTPRDVFDLERLAAHAVYMRDVPGGAFTTVLYAQDIDRTSWRQASSSSDRFGNDRYADRFGCVESAAGIADCGFQGRPRRYRFAGIEPRLRTPVGESVTVDIGARAHIESAVRRQFLAPGRTTSGGTMSRDNALLTNAFSAFAQSELGGGAWSVTPGVRLEHVRSRNENRLRGEAESQRYTQWLPGIGVAHNGTAGTTFFAGAHRGFAPPRPADVLEPGTGQSIVHVDPEVSWNVEIGARSEALRFAALDATLFRIDFSNQVVEGSLTGAGQRFVNAGTTLHQGIEFGARLTPSESGITPIAQVALTWLRDARYTSEQASARDGVTPVRGNRLPYAPRTLLSGTAGFATAGGFEFVVDAQHIGEQYSDDLNTRTPAADGQAGVLPAYTLFGVAASQRIARADARLFVRVSNLTDAVYIADRLEGIIVGTPRRLAAGVEWRF